MILQAGAFIKSTPALNNTEFEKGIIFLTEYNEKGAVGFILYKPFQRQLNDLEEFKHSPDFPLYIGGPVDKEHLFFLHRRPDLITGGAKIDDVFYGGDFKQAVAAINDGLVTTADIKLFIGYCGWDAGELEAEMEEGSWVIDENRENVFML
jgi:putative transcriptional regulator